MSSDMSQTKNTGPRVYKRVMLKLSGEMLGGESGKGLDVTTLKSFCQQVLDVQQRGVEIALVIGGGNIMRGNPASKESGMLHRATADYMGMLGTVINALALQDAIESLGGQTRVMSAIEARAVSEPYIRRRAIRHLEKKRIVILAGGTGHPYFSTDTTAALRAMEINAEILLKATKVDGIYSADPKKDPTAQRYEHLSYMQVLKDRLNVMDSTAISLCMDNKLPILVFSVQQPGNIMKACLSGEREIGTLVDDKGPA